MATVVPIFKKRSKSSPSNYCLVSLTSVVSKIFESIVRESICVAIILLLVTNMDFYLVNHVCYPVVESH